MTIDGIHSSAHKDYQLVQELKLMHQKVVHLEQKQQYLWEKIRHYQENEKILQQQNHDLEISLKTIIEGTSDAIFVKDNQGHYVVMNSACEKFLGYQIDQVIGKNDRDLLPPEIVQKVQEADNKVLASGETLHIEEEIPVLHHQGMVWGDRELGNWGIGEICVFHHPKSSQHCAMPKFPPQMELESLCLPR